MASNIFGGDNSKGASSQEKQLAGNQANLADDFHNDLNTTFANQQNILSGLQKNLSNIFAAGPSQYGFSAAETSALNTLATTQNAQNYQQARAAAAGAAAAQGGSAMLPSGATAGVQADIAQKAAQAQSNSLLGIQEAGYNAGRQNWNTALGGLENVAAQQNPTAYGNLAESAGSSAFNMADTIQKQEQAASPWAQVGGLVGSLAGTALNMVAPGAGTAVSGLTSGLTGSLNPAFKAAQYTAEPGGITGLGDLESGIPDMSMFGTSGGPSVNTRAWV